MGLTGGTGSGKSTVAARLAEHGAVVVDADKIAREVVEPGTEGLAEIVEVFGAGLLAEDGSLDRAAMAGKVFGDAAARAALNAIVHPRVAVRTGQLIAAAPTDAIVVHDVPLLVENGLAPGYHLVVVVHAPVEQRVRRLVESRGMAEADARARIAAQATDEQRRAVADVWLDNSGGTDELLAAVDALWADRLVPFEANVRLHRTPCLGPPVVVPYDPSWPVQAERLISRIAVAAGDRALRVDHIGSTSIPGLAAKDVIDLQLVVGSLEDADAIADELAAAGFPRYPGLDQDSPYPVDPDPGHWRKRVHVSADPGRRVNLHLRVHDWPAWRYALLFRDWLWAETEPRAEYERVKRALAPAFASDNNAIQYGTAKEPWFRAAVCRAEEWACRTGWIPSVPRSQESHIGGHAARMS